MQFTSTPHFRLHFVGSATGATLLFNRMSLWLSVVLGPKKSDQAVTRSTCISEISGSNVGRSNGCSDYSLLWLSAHSPGKYL